MPDAEASPLLPNEAPAENSIEGEPLRMKNSGPAGCRPAASCPLRRAGQRYAANGTQRPPPPPGRQGPVFARAFACSSNHFSTSSTVAL
jgi:hypothetical protein